MPRYSQDLVHVVPNANKPVSGGAIIYKDNKAVQFPDDFMLRQMETVKMIQRKEYSQKMIQTDDLLEEELIQQLKEWRQKRGGVIGLRNFRNFVGVSSQT